MSVAITEILVPAVPNATAAPLVLADGAFLASLTNAEQRVGALAVKDIATCAAAVGLLNDLTITATKLEKSRADLKAPFLLIGKRIDECAKAPAMRIENLKVKVRGQIQTFNDAQRAAAAKAEQDRQAELRKLEAERLRQQTEAKRKADEAAKLMAPTDLDFDDGPAPEAPKTAIELKIEAVKYAPAIVAPVVSGVTFRTRLIFRVLDVEKLPDAFVTRTANEKLIRETYCTGFKDGQAVPQLPGVEFKVDRQPVSNGKAQEFFE